MRLILIRHGETAHNKGNITLGRADIPLNDRGIAQARAVASSFTHAPAAIYTSPLRRASDTASMIAAHTRAPATIDDDLIEMDVGEMEHLTGTELRARYPEFLSLWMSDGDAVADARMPGGETLREVQERAWRFVERASASHSRETIVAVTHNFVILTLVCRALDLPLARFRRMRPVVGSKSLIEVREGQARLIRFNEVTHLAAAGLTDDPDAEVVR
jgi:broad specificity phosphatase PhoE